MAISKARQEATARWNAKAYDEIKLRVKKGQKEKIKEYAESKGESVNALLNRLLLEEMGED